MTTNLANVLNRFVRDESGSPAIEYSLMGAIIGIGCIAVFLTVGDSLGNLFGSGSNGASPVLENAANTASGG